MKVKAIEYHKQDQVQHKPVQHQPTPILNFTDVKTQKIGLGILGIISISIGYLALVVGTAPSLLLAIPTIALGGLLIWKVIRTKDYTDSNELQKYRDQAVYQPLELIIKEHGWEKMLQYGIPAQADFNRLCADTVKLHSFASDSIFTDYENLMQIRENLIAQGKPVQLEIPHPSCFKDRFLSEVKDKTLCQIFEQYDIEKLVKYNILPAELGKLHAEVYLVASAERVGAHDKAEAEFTKNYHDRVAAYKTVLREASGETPEQNEWLRVERGNVQLLSRNPTTATTHVRLSDEQLGSLKQIEEMRNQLIIELIAAQKSKDASRQLADAAFESSCARINEAYKF